MSLYLESVSFLNFSRCFLTFRAFLIKQWRSSGIEGAQPAHSKQKILSPKSRRISQTAKNTIFLEDSEDLLSGQKGNQRNTVLISQGDTNLGWGCACKAQKNRRISREKCLSGWGVAIKETLPFLAILTMSSATALGVMVTHLGAFLLNGVQELEIPFPSVCILPIFFNFQAKTKISKINFLLKIFPLRFSLFISPKLSKITH